MSQKGQCGKSRTEQVFPVYDRKPPSDQPRLHRRDCPLSSDSSLRIWVAARKCFRQGTAAVCSERRITRARYSVTFASKTKWGCLDQQTERRAKPADTRTVPVINGIMN